MTELGIFSTKKQNRIEQNRRKWKERLRRMDGARIPKRAMFYKLYGETDVGRLTKSWGHK
jgi:hypothetical protein